MAEIVKGKIKETKENAGAAAPEILEVHRVPVWMGLVTTAALLVALVTSLWVYMLQSHIWAAETNQQQAGSQNTQLKEQIDDLNLRLKAQGQALGEKVGMTSRQLQEKSDALVAEEKKTIAAASAASAVAGRLQQHQNATDQNVEQVRTEVASVKTDVSAVKTDVASTQAEQTAIKKSVAKVAADQGELGTKIATNGKELDALKRKGDRTFYEFAIERGAAPIHLATISLAVAKVDEKKNQFTLLIGSDDKKIVKNDQTLNQAITFYSGKDPEMYEIVVNGISKKMIAGYLSVPKDAPKPILP